MLGKDFDESVESLTHAFAKYFDAHGSKPPLPLSRQNPNRELPSDHPGEHLVPDRRHFREARPILDGDDRPQFLALTKVLPNRVADLDPVPTTFAAASAP